MGTQKHRLFLVIRLLVAFIVIFFILKLVLPSKEYTAIQSIIANISNYQSEIESWGYQVSVFDPISGNISKEDDFALIHYSGEIYEPVLILTDQAGGRWYFHNGFDQYAQQTESIEQTPIIGGEEVLKIVTQLQLYKAHINRPPLKENKFKPDKMSYYDVVVEMDFEGYSLETGEYVYIRNSGPYETQYCSNNFEEHRCLAVITPEKKSYVANQNIKKRFTAEQLLDLYHQGLSLQDRLMKLYEQK